MNSFEPFPRIREGHENYHLLEDFLRKQSGRVNEDLARRQENMPENCRLLVDEDFRILPPSSVYGEAERNKVERVLSELYGTTDENVVRQKESTMSGFVFEMLKTSIMHKMASDRFVIVRSSRYDDLFNNVDNILVEKKSGNVICALDDCSPKTMHDQIFKEKKKNILNRNMGLAEADASGILKDRRASGKKGASLKYGISLNPQGGEIECKEQHELPIFFS